MILKCAQCLALLAVVSTGAAAASTEVAGFTLVKSLGGIDEYRLDSNGLTVLLVPDHSAPVVTFEVTYQVGSRNEVTGTTGATHILEHLMCKGSIEGDVAIEADRMRNLWLHESDRQSEMTVVRNEYERGKNEPENVLVE